MSASFLRIHPLAIAEAREGYHWYRERSSRVAERFKREVDRAIEAISQHPHAWPPFEDDTRRFVLTRFPYSVVYRVGEDEIVVVAVMHGRREPGYWRRRR